MPGRGTVVQLPLGSDFVGPGLHRDDLVDVLRVVLLVAQLDEAELVRFRVAVRHPLPTHRSGAVRPAVVDQIGEGLWRRGHRGGDDRFGAERDGVVNHLERA